MKDQGYESDSTLVFRKKDHSLASPLSPVEQKQAYLNLQAGGEVPVQGFRKQAPEKPKGELFLCKEIFFIEFWGVTLQKQEKHWLENMTLGLRINNLESNVWKEFRVGVFLGSSMLHVEMLRQRNSSDQ